MAVTIGAFACDDTAGLRNFVGKVPSDTLYSHKCNAIENPCPYLREMDEAENLSVLGDHRKIQGEINNYNPQKIGAIGGVVGAIVGGLFCIPVGEVVISLVFLGAVTGIAPGVLSSVSRRDRIIHQIEHDRLSRLDHKVNSIAEKVLQLSTPERNIMEIVQLNTAKDYFARTRHEYAATIAVNVRRV